MKEIKVATLTTEERKEYKELNKLKDQIETLMAQGTSARIAFWGRLAATHNLHSDGHYIRGNAIYNQVIGEVAPQKE